MTIAHLREGSGPLVLFLHGVGGRKENWVRQVQAAAAAGFTAVAWDAPGYGGSSVPEGAPDFRRYADAAAGLIGDLGLERAHVVGLSMGGRIALDLWARHRPHVASLTLADTSAGSKTVADPARVAAFLAARRRPLLEEGRTPADIAPGLTDALAGPQASAEARAELLASHTALRTDGYLWALEAVTAFHDFPAWDTIDVPVQVIVGEHDAQATPAYAAEVAAAIAGAALTVIPRAGHVSNVEQPDAFNAALLAFLDRQR